MSTITLEAVQAEQAKLGAMIEQLQAQARSIIAIPEASIELRPGEHYAGAVLDDAGKLKHHLVLMAAKPESRLAWQDAMEWAASVDGVLPDRQEQALIFANCKPHLVAAWHWSSVEHESDASYAWGCGFGHGNQSDTRKSYEGCAVAVRRLTA